MTLDELYEMRKVWEKAYDLHRVKESNRQLHQEDYARYWFEVHLAYSVQAALRGRLEAMTQAYVSEHTESLIAQFRAGVIKPA